VFFADFLPESNTVASSATTAAASIPLPTKSHDGTVLSLPLQVEQESERIGKDAMECQVIADDAQADLAVAMPALEKAMMEVDKLDKTAITEVGCM